MASPISPRPSADDELTTLRAQLDELRRHQGALEQKNRSLEKQLAWFQRQLFGRKSEKRQMPVEEQQSLFPVAPPPGEVPAPEVEIAAHRRRKQPLAGTPDDSGLRFDQTRVPVKTIEIIPEELKGLQADDYEVIRTETTYRLAQRPASYVVLKYVRPVLKHRPSQALTSTPAPANVLEKSLADVSFLANVIIDKLVYHLPLYRQHQRLTAAHIEISRSTLTNVMNRAAALLEPVAQAVLRSILQSKVLAMDETPIKAGRKKDKDARHGQMKTGYYWPLYGDRDEVYFSFAPTRAAQHIHRVLADFTGTLLSDGYSAYASYIAKVEGVTGAQCWAHSRRHFENAQAGEPELTNTALDYIGALYAVEKQIRDRGLSASDKLAYRGEYSKDIVEAFMLWCESIAQRPDLIALDSPIVPAVNYVLNRRAALKVFLENPDVPLDTNHVERTLRIIPMGKKNWLFSWTEVGAHRVGILQTLLVTCKLQGVDPYVYLVDVLQRIDRHPAKDIDQLTPRLWKEHFADNPLRSDIDRP